MRREVVEVVESLCTAAEDLLMSMAPDHNIRPEATNYQAVLDMYRSAARLGVGRRDWAAAAHWLLEMLRRTGNRVSESAYTDVLEICAAVSGPGASPSVPSLSLSLSLPLALPPYRPC